MNKKILLGSIISVVILILVSFTSVVGYTRVNSNAKTSPLFRVRTNRAIDKESKDVTRNYIGRGEETDIHLSSRMKRAEEIQKAIDIISKMDDKAFSKFISQIILKQKYPGKMTIKEIPDVLQALKNMRRNPNVIKYYYTENNPRDETFEYFTCLWLPPCIIMNIIGILAEALLAIIGSITKQNSCFRILTGYCWCQTYYYC